MSHPQSWPARSAGPHFPSRPLASAILRVLPGHPRYHIPAIQPLDHLLYSTSFDLSASLEHASSSISLQPSQTSPLWFDFLFPTHPTNTTQIHFSISASADPVASARLPLHDLSNAHTRLTLPLLDAHGKLVARLSLTVLHVTPHSPSFAKPHHHLPFVPRFTGHRGMGSSGPHAPWRPLENSIHSFLKATLPSPHVEAVELDVQLTADHRPVIFHNWYIPSPHPGPHSKSDDNAFKTPVYSLTFDQFDTCFQTMASQTTRSSLANSDPDILALADNARVPNTAFDLRARTLLQVLDTLPVSVGVLVEVKYPAPDVQASMRLPYPEKNAIVNCVLDDIMASTNIDKRQIAFLGFEPDICDMLALKQQMFPVYLSHCENLDKPCDMEDIRTTDLRSGLRFVKSNGLDGLMILNELVELQSEKVEEVVRERVPILTYGKRNTDSEFVGKQFDKGVGGVIADDVDVMLKTIDIPNSEN